MASGIPQCCAERESGMTKKENSGGQGQNDENERPVAKEKLLYPGRLHCAVGEPLQWQ
jgi:hypothetical protein